jgi:hypothetical protein
VKKCLTGWLDGAPMMRQQRRNGTDFFKSGCARLGPTPRIYSICENLVLWARSEIIGSALLDKAFLNPKHEIRKPKQYRMTKIKMIQTKDIPGIAM